jgi:hypothetical protein
VEREFFSPQRHRGHRERRGFPFSGDTEIGKSPIAVPEIKKEFVESEFFCEAMEFYPREHLSRAEIKRDLRLDNSHLSLTALLFDFMIK